MHLELISLGVARHLGRCPRLTSFTLRGLKTKNAATLNIELKLNSFEVGRSMLNVRSSDYLKVASLWPPNFTGSVSAYQSPDYPAGGIALHQGHDLFQLHIIVIAGDGMFQAACGCGEGDSLFGFMEINIVQCENKSR
jgi:hypothetical protein